MSDLLLWLIVCVGVWYALGLLGSVIGQSARSKPWRGHMQFLLLMACFGPFNLGGAIFFSALMEDE